MNSICKLEKVVSRRLEGFCVWLEAVVFAAFLLNDQAGFRQFLEVMGDGRCDRFLAGDVATNVAGG